MLNSVTAGKSSCICLSGSGAESVCLRWSSAACPAVGGEGGQGYPENIKIHAMNQHLILSKFPLLLFCPHWLPMVDPSIET